jgi:hypothetical protein
VEAGLREPREWPRASLPLPRRPVYRATHQEGRAASRAAGLRNLGLARAVLARKRSHAVGLLAADASRLLAQRAAILRLSLVRADPQRITAEAARRR